MPKKKKFIRKIQKTNAPKKCVFCADKKEPLFSDTATLNKFITDRAKIVPMSRSGLCTKHQKRLAVAIKQARHLALLPFIVRV
jgi:small subunit ribosomal protein S18